MTVIYPSDSPSVITISEGTGFTVDHPIIGWNNRVITTNVTALNGSAANYPVSNLANAATFLKWKSATNATTSLSMSLATGGTIDYVAIAGHNLATVGATVSVLRNATVMAGPKVLSNNGPTIFRFSPITSGSPADTITLSIGMPSPAVAAAEVAVLYVGKLLLVERRLYAQHVAINHGRTWRATNGMAESGQFLGRIVLAEFQKTKVPLSLLTPAWYRANMDAFLAAAAEVPFFFAWRPQTYPAEVGYAWLTNMPEPTPTPPSNLIALTLEMTGVT